MRVNYIKIDFETCDVKYLFVFIQNRCYIDKIINNSVVDRLLRSKQVTLTS